MFTKYIKLAFRNLLRQKFFSAINISGFAIGLAICLIITFYVLDDLSYDRFHQDHQDIYRILTRDISKTEEELVYGITSGPLVKGLKDGIPEVVAATRVTHFGRSPIRKAGSEQDEEEESLQVNTLIADSDFFQVFSFKILTGNRDEPLNAPDGIYLTSETAEELFGDEDPIGQPLNFLELENAFVAGIVDVPPANSSIRFDCLVPLHLEWSPIWWDSWTNVALTGYLKLQPGSQQEVVEDKINNYAHESGFAKIWQPQLQRLADIHLNSGYLRFDVMNWRRGDRSGVLTTAIIAILILMVASINFINLSSARANKRAKEVGLRKIIGSKRRDLIVQFLCESLIITYLAAFLSTFLYEISLPHINNFLHRRTAFTLFSEPKIILVFLAAITLIGILAGIYPALIISGFKSLSVLKGNFYSSKKGLLVRRILVVGQFTVAISLISAVMVVQQQIGYLSRIDLGYDRENVIEISGIEEDIRTAFRQKLSEMPEVEAIGTINSYPGGTLQKFQVVPEGFETEQGAMFDRIFIDAGLLSTLKIELLAGRDFSLDLDREDGNSVIINETAADFAGWGNEAVGRTIRVHREDGSEDIMTIVGVVNDFNFTTTRRKVNPMFLAYTTEAYAFLVRLRNDSIETITKLEKFYEEMEQENPFNYQYFDRIFNYQFRDDRNFATQITVFSTLAIIISCLGLLGLSSYMTEQKTKEIGIRKVLGSSVFQIIKLLSLEFTRWIFIAILIAFPLTWYTMNIWLGQFIYRMQFPFWFFPVSGSIVIFIALVTISFQTIRAANYNPVNALKYE